MLLTCGPVTKQHFMLAAATAALGLVVMLVALLVPATLSRLLLVGGGLLLLVGVLQLLMFGFMLKQWGWREQMTGTRTVWACQFCGAQFPTYEAAAQHEQVCPQRGNVQAPGAVATVIGVPVGTPVGTRA
mmetsp:Transcript_118309/g.230142  ORF Transcript_118309/g.230142 Transcript_118309/m.230142 type:complete len:130 (-) Transcript_118309:360-749(-)